MQVFKEVKINDIVTKIDGFDYHCELSALESVNNAFKLNRLSEESYNLLVDTDVIVTLKLTNLESSYEIKSEPI